MSIPHSGNIPEKKIINERVTIKCPNCASMDAILKEWILIEGDLKNYHLIHTEVYELLECESCKHGWQKFSFL